jgi:hypothetical protein
MTPCMPCSFGLLPHPRSGMCALPIGLLELTVIIRWIPLVTAACGTRVARPAKTTMLAPGGDGSQLSRRVRPIPGNRFIVAKSPEGLAAAGGETRTPRRMSSSPRGQEAVGSATCGPGGRLVTAPARCCHGLPVVWGPRTDRRGVRFSSGRGWAAGLICDSVEPVVTPGTHSPPICRSRVPLACTPSLQPTALTCSGQRLRTVL